jgi:hypothetical protein
MSFPEIPSSAYTLAQKQAIFKLAVELVKADNRIHSQEVVLLAELQDALSIGQEQIDNIHYYSIQNATAVLKSIDDEKKDALCQLFTRIMCSDNDINFDEHLLLSSLIMSIRSKSETWCSVVTIPFVDSQSSERQIIFLEKKHCAEAHEVLDNAYDSLLITKAFGDIGLKFLYLPDILKRWSSQIGAQNNSPGEKHELLKRSLGFIVPAGNKIKLSQLDSALKALDTPTFLRVILSRYGLSPDVVPYDAFLLLKISDSQILNDSNSLEGYTNFLCIDLSRNVKQRIFEFISQFNEQDHLISYEGYYKFIYDYLSSESKSVNPVRIDSNYQFYAGDESSRQISFESSPQARTFFLLLLYYSPYGIRQSVFNEAIDILDTINLDDYVKDSVFDYPSFRNYFRKQSDEASMLIANTMEIYHFISTKNDESKEFVKYVTSIFKHRSSLKNYINKGFLNCEILANPDRFLVRYDNLGKSYVVDASLDDFQVSENGQITSVLHSALWQRLSKSNRLDFEASR